MPKRKCVKSYRPLQHRNSVTRIKQVENQSRNHALRKRTRQYMHESGNAFFCRHPTTSYTGLMRPVSVNAINFHKRETGVELPFYESIRGNFMVFKIDLKQIYCSHRRTRQGVGEGGRLPGLENFQGKLCFQGKHKLFKNPE